MDRLSALIGKDKRKERPPDIEIDQSDESRDSYDDDIQLLPYKSTKNNPVTPKSPRGRSYSLYDTRLSIRFPKCHLPEQSTSVEMPTSNFMTTGSLPKFFRRSDRRLRRLNTELLEAIKICNKLEAEREFPKLVVKKCIIKVCSKPNLTAKIRTWLTISSDTLYEKVVQAMLLKPNICPEVFLYRADIFRFLNLGANPNATCHLGCVSACHLAALTGGETLLLLMDHGAKHHRVDRCGRTPLHLAAWSGNIAEIAILLDFPQVLQLKLKQKVTSEIEEEITNLCLTAKDKANIRCKTDELHMMLPKDWLDNIDHHCRDLQKSIPHIQPGWTALHAACSNAKYECVRILLAAGAEPNVRDYVGRAPLDVVGSAYYEGHTIDKKDFTEVIELLLKYDSRNSTIMERKPFDTVLHTAVEVESLEAITDLVCSGASVTCHNRNGLTPLHVCVNKKLKEHLQILANSGFYKGGSLTSIVDARNKNGHTVLHAAVLAGWAPGVCVCLEAGANITAKDVDGETPIHLAAALGDFDILNEILSVAKQGDCIDFRNSKGETALFKAVMHAHIDSVKKILKEGASIKLTLPRQVSVFHVAAELGSFEVLKVLLDHDYTITRSYINFITADDKKGFGPIHFATWNNHAECVKLLLSMNAYVSLRTTYGLHKLSTPLHLAAIKNNVEIAKILYKFNEETIHNIDIMGWTPLHTASHHKSRDVVLFLLQQGADLSAYTNGPNKMKKTSIEMIMDNLSKPTEFIENVFDSCIINNNLNLQDSNYDTTVDYKILLPKEDNSNQMKVLQAMVKTGNRRNQRRLLLHPLIESFLYLKWKGLVPYFYATLLLNGIFVISLSMFIISIFYYKDKEERLPNWLSGYLFVIVVYISAFLLIIQEILHIIVGKSYYYMQIETWVKFSSISLATILPYIVAKMSPKVNWPRHVATVTLLLSWIQMMFMLSRFPKWGYYVLMFKKVSLNVMKILLTFVFLLIGFSLSFMIEFHSKPPFENPFAAFVKTMVMMTSEFDFDDLINKESLGDFTTSFLFARLMFLVFLILTAIVLMNLMVGVAVNDLHNLQVQGNIQRLKMQVEFLTSLETLVHNNIFKKILPKRITNNILIPKLISLSPNNSLECPTYLPARIRESAFNIGQNRKKETEEHPGLVNIHSKYKRTDKPGNLCAQSDTKMRNVLNKKLAVADSEYLELGLQEVKNKLNAYSNNTEHSIEMLNIKMDSILKRLENISK